MDTLYYSNHCEHCKKILLFITKSGLTERISAICIDKRIVDPSTGVIYVELPNGKRVGLPLNINRVPSLISVQHNKTQKLVMGNDIITHLGGSSVVNEPSSFSKDMGSSYSSYATLDKGLSPIIPETYKSSKSEAIKQHESINPNPSQHTESVKMSGTDMDKILKEFNITRDADMANITKRHVDNQF